METQLPHPATGSAEDDSKVEIVEGQASMLYDKKEVVFYNKVQVSCDDSVQCSLTLAQVLNRDLSIQVISHFSQIRMSEWKHRQANRSAESSFVAPEGAGRSP
jgi:hypothetical protein